MMRCSMCGLVIGVGGFCEDMIQNPVGIKAHKGCAR